MRIVDDLIFSPNEIVPEREEFSLSKMGLSVVGFQLSEAGTDAVKIRGVRGPVVVATNPKERVATISLAVREDVEASLATAAYRLQQKLGQIEEVGDWLKRVPYVGDFAGPVVTQVKREVSLGNIGDWQAGECPDVTFQLLVGSEWFDAVEEESEVETEQVGRATIVKVPPSRGTTRGLVRMRIKNEGEEHLRGLLEAMECRDAPADLDDPTAQLAYNCADLTPKGGAEVKTVSGLEVVEHASLTAGWITVLDSEIEGVGHMAHLGGRRPWLRVQNPEEAEAQLRLRWRPLGMNSWEENPIVPVPHHGGDYQHYDMGQVLPLLAKLGDQRWQFQVLACAPSGAGKLRLHQVYPAPTEQYAVVRTPAEIPAPDAQAIKSAGTIVEANSGPGGKTWSNAADAASSNNVYATSELTGSNATEFLKFTNFGELPANARIAQVILTLERKAELKEAGAIAVQTHLFKVNASGVIEGDYPEGQVGGWEQWSTGDEVVSYEPWKDNLPSVADFNDKDWGFALLFQNASGVKTKIFIDEAKLLVYYTQEEDEAMTCFSAKSVEFRSDGVERQHQSDDVWGPLSPISTTMPYDPPGAVEGRPSRVLLLPSQGDLGDLPDPGDAEIAIESLHRRAAFHLTQDAGS